MGSDFEASAATPPAPVVSRQFQNRSGAGYFRDQTHAPPSEKPAAAEVLIDVSSLLGMPADQVPETVRHTLGVLMAEIDRLRDALVQAQHQIAWLETRVDQHPDVPVLNKRAFLRDLSLALARIDEPEGDELGRVAALRLMRGEKLIEAEGDAGFEAAKAHVAAILRANLRQSDLIGYVDGGLFLLCLIGTAGPAADEKVTRLAGVTTAAPFEWEGTPIMLEMAVGQAVLRARESVEDACKAAIDAALGARGASRLTR